MTISDYIGIEINLGGNSLESGGAEADKLLVFTLGLTRKGEETLQRTV